MATRNKRTAHFLGASSVGRQCAGCGPPPFLFLIWSADTCCRARCTEPCPEVGRPGPSLAQRFLAFERWWCCQGWVHGSTRRFLCLHLEFLKSEISNVRLLSALPSGSSQFRSLLRLSLYHMRHGRAACEVASFMVAMVWKMQRFAMPHTVRETKKNHRSTTRVLRLSRMLAPGLQDIWTEAIRR